MPAAKINKDGEFEQQIEIPFAVTETGANTFTQVAITLPTEPGSGLVFDLEKVYLNMTRPGMAANTLGFVTVQCTHSSQSTILATSDSDTIWAQRTVASNASTNADFYTFSKEEYMKTDIRNTANYLADRVVYVAIQGSAQAGVKAVSGIMAGKLRRVKLEQLTSLLLNQLA